jgi:hypothetical protein
VALKVRICAGAPIEDDELGRVSYGYRTQKDGVDETEDGGVGADAECESEHGDGGEARRFAQHAEGVANVLKNAREKIATHFMIGCEPGIMKMCRRGINHLRLFSRKLVT